MLRHLTLSVGVTVTWAPQDPPKPDCGHAAQPAWESVRCTSTVYGALSSDGVSSTRNGAVPVSAQVR